MSDTPRIGSKEAEVALGHLYGMTRQLSGEIATPNGPIKINADVMDGCTAAFGQVKQFIDQHSKCGVRELKPVKDAPEKDGEGEAEDAAVDTVPET